MENKDTQLRIAKILLSYLTTLILAQELVVVRLFVDFFDRSVGIDSLLTSFVFMLEPPIYTQIALEVNDCILFYYYRYLRIVST